MYVMLFAAAVLACDGVSVRVGSSPACTQSFVERQVIHQPPIVRERVVREVFQPPPIVLERRTEVRELAFRDYGCTSSRAAVFDAGCSRGFSSSFSVDVFRDRGRSRVVEKTKFKSKIR